MLLLWLIDPVLDTYLAFKAIRLLSCIIRSCQFRALNSLIYASVTYPTYLAGGAWLFSPATAKRLLMALEKPLSYVHIDDMLISGIFAEIMDVRRVCLKTIGYLYELSLKKCHGDHILAVLQLEDHEILNTILDYREASIKCYAGHSSYKWTNSKLYTFRIRREV